MLRTGLYSLLLLMFLVSACSGPRQTALIQNIPPVRASGPYLVGPPEVSPRIITPEDLVQLRKSRQDTISLIGVGDIMMGTNFPDDSYLPPNQGRGLLREVEPILQDATVTFGNLEGVILNEGGDAKKCKDPSVCYIFRSPEYLAQRFVDAGFDVMSTANNHAGDFGAPGRVNTQRVLDSLGIHHAGQQNTPFTYFVRNGLIFGFAAFSPNTGTMSINDIPGAQQIVRQLDAVADIVIVSFHGGAEGSDFQHVPREHELFYGEDRGDVYAFSHAVIDAGADVVFGHGPHVTRALEVYNNRFIAYSLGNFSTYARFNLRGENGLAPIVKIFTRPDGVFLYGEITPVIQRGAGGPSIDSNRRVIKVLQELTKKDFPEGQINIDETGRIHYLPQEF